MSETPLRVLLVEDNPGDARILTQMLSKWESEKFEVVHAKRLEEAAAMMTSERFDAVLLDLSLPDSSGLDTIDQAQEFDPDRSMPIIVVTGRYGDTDARPSVAHGAQDFLQKNSLKAESLVRSITLAIDRQRALAKRREVESGARRAREIESLETMGGPMTTMVTARAYGLERLSESSSDTFEALVQQYCDLVEAAVQQRRFKVDSKVSQGLNVMAQRLGFLRAGPRDVVELHLKAIKSMRPLKMTTSYVIAEEARLMLLELMGDLTAYYRDHMVPIRKTADSARSVAERKN